MVMVVVVVAVIIVVFVVVDGSQWAPGGFGSALQLFSSAQLLLSHLALDARGSSSSSTSVNEMAAAAAAVASSCRITV